MVFIDFRKAFDSIHRGKMMEILPADGIPQKILNDINLMYCDSKTRVITPDGETYLFYIVAVAIPREGFHLLEKLK